MIAGPHDLVPYLLDRNGRRERDEVRFQCPYPEHHEHGDADPSARFNQAKGVWYCDVCAEKGHWTELARLLGLEVKRRSQPGKAQVVAHYDYRDESGEVLRRKLRWEPGFDGRDKSFTWRTPDGHGGWKKSEDDGVPTTLYGSEKLPAAREAKAIIFVVEGEKDVDSGTALGIVAVCNPEGAAKSGQHPKWKDRYSQQLAGLPVVVIADKDGPGRAHAQAAASSLSKHAESVAVIELPGSGVKDLSDWVAARPADETKIETRAELERLVRQAPQWEPSDEPTVEPGAEEEVPYRATDSGLVFMKRTKDGKVPVPLTNFTARIVAEEIEDDGAEARRLFEIEARLNGRDHRFSVPASSFPGMNWVTRHLGPAAVVHAGFGTRDRARVAIQLLSGEIGRREVFAHTGWRQIGKKWCFLHAAGAIGPIGPITGVCTCLPSELAPFALPEPATGEDLRTAIRASLGTLRLVPAEVSFPLHCAISRSVLGPSDFALHLAGATGEGKTELAAQAQQHFGAGLDARHLPGSWSSTGNALEALAFTAKDALLVVDDFAPEGTRFDVQRLHKEAARVLRAQGNRSGRQRMRPDGTLRAPKPPRGLVVSTGEDIPGPQSIRGRILVLEVTAGSLDWDLLTRCQANAAAGLYAQALAAFIQWLAPNYGQLREQLRHRATELRRLATTSSTSHRRTPSIVAELALGWETFLRFAREAEAITGAEAKELWRRCWAALGNAAANQEAHLSAADPVGRFLELLRSALSSGDTHLVSEKGEAPPTPGSWGWRAKANGPGKSESQEWWPQGSQIGWVRGGDLYLDPQTAYRAVQRMATSEPVVVTERTLWKRLRERGLLASTDETRKRNLVRVSLQGARREVLHLRASTLMPTEPAQSAQSAQDPTTTGLPGPIPWADSEPAPQETAQENSPEEPVTTGSDEDTGPNGPIGPILETRDTGVVEDEEKEEVAV